MPLKFTKNFSLHTPAKYIIAEKESVLKRYWNVAVDKGEAILRKMRKISGLNLLIVFFLVLCLSGAAFGYELRNKSYQAVSGDYTEYLIAAYGNVPVYDQNKEIIDTGIIKDLPDGKAMSDWYGDVHAIVVNTRQDMRTYYYYPEGPVLSYGYDLLGTICVGIYEETNVDRETTDEIYRIISSKASESGIDDVPVIFVSEPIADLGMPYKTEWMWVIIGVKNTVRDLFGTNIFAAAGI